MKEKKKVGSRAFFFNLVKTLCLLENVLMRRLPKGYILVKTNTTHKLAICGHPRGQLFRTLGKDVVYR